MTNLAEFSEKSAALSTDFGYEMASRYFGESAVESLPKYVRGAKKGLPKGRIGWKKVEKGGWVSTGFAAVDNVAAGYVERRVGKVISAELYTGGNQYEEKVVHATWEKSLKTEAA